jgi:predicted SnoaL-like aldol condensation-catalyzing enzyme
VTGTGTQAIADRKQAAKDFLLLVVAGQIEKAYEKYVDFGGKHHNVFFPAGFKALQKAMMEAHVQYPDKVFRVKNVLGDGDLVAVHSHLVLQSGDPGLSVVHILRFQGGKIVEMWDLSQPIPADSPNKDGAF